MIISNIKQISRLIFLMIFPISLYAAVPQWKIIPKESSLTFTATQNSAPVSGEFKSFDGTIAFDPAQLSASNVKIIINMASLSTSYGDLTTTLATSDWFDVTKFPQAVFTATQFKKINDKQYEAIGTLTIRDKTFPINVMFNSDDFTQKKVLVIGTALLNRTNFSVGQGEWAGTDEIKAEVTVNFRLAAQKQ